MNLYFAPLEGVAGFVYRNIMIEMFGGADKYFAPFVTPSQNPKMAGKEIRDILPENNMKDVKMIPQILTNNADYFIRGAKQIRDMGYKEINFNAGCPSGTVVSKGRGAGFLKDKENLDSFFDKVFGVIDKEGLDMAVSVKTRIGFYDPAEFSEILDVYNRYPFKEVIVHSRTREQLYKGEPDYKAFEYACENTNHSLCYNGNIYTVEDYISIVDNFDADSVMMGRGILRNPNLFNEIKGSSRITKEQIDEFQNCLYSEYKGRIPSEKQVLFKMKEIWNYISYNFEEQHKCIKLIRKAQSYRQYDDAVRRIADEFELTGRK